MLASCGSTAPKIQKATQISQKPLAEEKVYNSDDYLRLARENGDSATYLFNAADAAHKEQRFEKSMIVIKSMQQTFVPLEIKQKLLVLEVRNFIALGHLNEAEKALTADLAKTTEIRHDINRLKADLYGKQHRYIESLRSLFQLEKAAENGEVPDNKEDIARTIWHQLNQLPDVSFEIFEYQDYTNAKSWIQLVRITRLYTGQPSVLQRQLKNWYDFHPWHTAMHVLPESFQRSLEAELRDIL
ncbi:MAG: penicillin-binding protein activator, partial [Psychrosphaera sp.]|nr:penicillin-binding protein activator [Psychrosphaera sp.]